MPSCVFFAKDDTCVCRVLSASAEGTLPDGIAVLLAERYCNGGKFITCPIFRRFQRSLAQAHHTLSALMPRATEPDSEETSGVFAKGRRRRRQRACG